MTDKVQTALISVIGSVIVALITTIGTIWGTGNRVNQTGEQARTLDDQLRRTEARVRSLGALPVGTVIASMLKESEFAKAAGDADNFDLTKSEWTLANGKAVPGTRYAALLNNANVPDLRGVFLRGKNNGRSDGKGNGEEVELGDFRWDQLQDHVHEFNRGGITQQGTQNYAQAANANSGVPQENTNDIVQGKHGALGESRFHVRGCEYSP